MPKGKSLSPQDIISIIEAYNKTKSVWKAAAITGFSGQAIHTTLRKLDLIQYPNFSEAEIEEIKNNLYAAGAVYASMSGSGSSVYGLFESEPVLDFKLDNCFVTGGMLK